MDIILNTKASMTILNRIEKELDFEFPVDPVMVFTRLRQINDLLRDLVRLDPMEMEDAGESHFYGELVDIALEDISHEFKLDMSKCIHLISDIRFLSQHNVIVSFKGGTK